MSKVYVVQNQLKFNDQNGLLEPKFQLDEARKYGELLYLLSPQARPFSPEHIIKTLREKLTQYSNEDYLLLIGNPCLIGFSVAIAADFNDGIVNVLQWHGVKKKYIPVNANLLFVSENDRED